jgi:hypothetical protein
VPNKAELAARLAAAAMSLSPQAVKLRKVLESACSEHGCGLSDMTVLSTQNDPYRLDTERHHRDGKWVARQIEKLFQPHQRIHIRGIHYAIVVQGDVRKPDRRIYRNTDKDFEWLEGAVADARWLGYVSFERIADNRNGEPGIFRTSVPIGPLFRQLSARVELGEVAFELGSIHIDEPSGRLYSFDRAQPYALAIFGEKSSLDEVLDPIARRYGADLYVGAGEISSTHLHQIAKDAASDGRPLAVITCADFDPSGRQMSISIGRKLQALRDVFFPNLRFEVVEAALTVERVRELGLPSTPLKATELRANRWREAFGQEQTEIDALATLRPNDLRRIVETAIEPYFDSTLAGRIQQARADWEAEAQRIIDEHVDEDELEDIRANVDIIETEADERIEAIKTELEERVAVENERLQALVAGIRLPRAPALPEA